MTNYVARMSLPLLRPFASVYQRTRGFVAVPFFLLVAIALVVCATSLQTSLQWLSALSLMWLCVGTCWLHREIHQEKKKIIEGMQDAETAPWAALAEALPVGVVWLAHIFLLVAIVLLLRISAVTWGFALFNPAPHDLSAWVWYGLDLVGKATLFDIPEVFQLDLVQIKHVGWLGGALVLSMRMLVLALLVSAVMRWHELFKLVERTVSMAQYSPSLARERLQLIVQLYPSQVRRLCHWVFAARWMDKPESRCAILETLGHSQTSLASETLVQALAGREQDAIRAAALRGLALYGTGPLGPLQAMVEESPRAASLALREEACHTLAAWSSAESLELLHRMAHQHPEDAMRLLAIKALGRAHQPGAFSHLLDVMYAGQRSKEERFAAKDAILELFSQHGPMPLALRTEVEHQLVHSPYPDNRRFSGMLLDASPSEGSFLLLAQQLQAEQDPHALLYIIQGLSNAAHRVCYAPKTNAKAYVQGLSELNAICVEEKVYTHLRGFVFSEDSALIVPRLASIQAMADFTGIWTCNGADEPESPDPLTLMFMFRELLKHPNLQVADVARDAFARLPQDWHDAYGDGIGGSSGYRREVITCAGIVSHANAFRPSRPAMPEEIQPRLDEQPPSLSATDTALPPSASTGPTPSTATGIDKEGEGEHLGGLQPGPQMSKTQEERYRLLAPPTLVDLPGLAYSDDIWAQMPHWALARFRHVRTLSQGSLATVYRVYDRVKCVEKALKVANPDGIAETLREIEALHACSIPGMIPVIDHFPDLNLPMFTVPWVEQTTLFQAMVSRRKFGMDWSPEEVEGILVSLALVLQEMHTRGWCHGDIKPENIFYAGDKVILYDMGAARQVADGPRDTATASIGTPYYMAPEQVHRQPIDKHVDIYALGILAYELLAGALPLGTAPPALCDLRDDLAPGIDLVLRRATAYRPEDRFATPEAFRLALLSSLHKTTESTTLQTSSDASPDNFSV